MISSEAGYYGLDKMKAPNLQNRAVATSFLKGLDLITVLARRLDGLTVPAIVTRLRRPRTSILRMLHTLELYGLAVRDKSVWRATDRFHDWCNRNMYQELRVRYHESIRLVAAEVDELVELGVGEGNGVRFIDWVQAEHSVTIDPLKSSLYPLHLTATGKLLLSQRDDLCASLKEPRLLSEIEQARVSGIAWNFRESDTNVIAVAAWAGSASATTPVVCVKWPFFRYSDAKAARALDCIRRVLPLRQQPIGC